MSRVLKNKNNQITQGYSNQHLAVDLVGSGSTLDDIVAHSDGTVNWCQTGLGNMKGASGNASYGNCVKIAHEGEYETLYAHMSKVYVSNGQRVSKGQVIGYMGDSGNAYGSHLHFEVRRNGVRINPIPYIDNDLPNNSTPQQTTGFTGDITYKVHDIVYNNWHNEVINDTDFAGSNKNQPIDMIKAKCVHGKIFIEVHLLEASETVWCGEVSSDNYNNTDENSYAGVLGKCIDMVKIRSTHGHVEYRVKTLERGWLPWVNSLSGDYAGNRGETIVAIQMR